MPLKGEKFSRKIKERGKETEKRSRREDNSGKICKRKED